MSHSANLGDLVEIETGKLDVNSSNPNGRYPFFTCAVEPNRIDHYSYDFECVLVAGNGDLNVKYYAGKFNAYQRTYILKPKGALEGRYLYHFMCRYVDRLRAMSVGGVIKYIKLNYLTDAKIPLPPLSEQRRIAAILDQADALRAKRQQMIVKLDEWLRAIFLERFGHPASAPFKLPLVTLGELGEWQSGGTPPRSDGSYFKGKIPWFSSGELEAMRVSESEEHISTVALERTSAKSVPAGALMLGMYDTAALKASIAAVDCSCNQAIAFSVLSTQIADPVYVYFAISIGRKIFRRMQRGVRQKNLNLDMIRAIRIPLADLLEQRAFAQVVSRCEWLTQKAICSLTMLDALFHSLQHRAFRGEL